MKVFLSALLPLVAASSVRFPVVQDDIKFNTVHSIRASQVNDVLSALNGYTVHPNHAWQGIRSYNPIKHPTFFLIADFEMPQDFPELTMNSNLHFELENDENLDNEFGKFLNRSKKIWPDASGSMMPIVAAGEADQELPEEAIEVLRAKNASFDTSNDSDRAFIMEYFTLKNLIDETPRLPVNQVPSTVYWISLDSIRRLATEYGVKHEKPQKAAKLFSELVGEATGKLESHPRSLFMVIQETDKPVSRARRAAEDGPTPSQPPVYSAYEYDADWCVVFAMVTFTMLVFVLGIYATSIGLWFMDPGRDSIIYRMTSQRMKME